MEKYSVSGMSCAACVARVEKAVSNVPGVSSCTVSLLTNSMGVEGSAGPAEIIAAVEKAGYGAKPLSGKSQKKSIAESANQNEELLKNTEAPILKKRLISSSVSFGPDVFQHGTQNVELAAPRFFHRQWRKSARTWNGRNDSFVHSACH